MPVAFRGYQRNGDLEGLLRLRSQPRVSDRERKVAQRLPYHRLGESLLFRKKDIRLGSRLSDVFLKQSSDTKGDFGRMLARGDGIFDGGLEVRPVFFEVSSKIVFPASDAWD